MNKQAHTIHTQAKVEGIVFDVNIFHYYFNSYCTYESSADVIDNNCKNVYIKNNNNAF